MTETLTEVMKILGLIMFFQYLCLWNIAEVAGRTMKSLKWTWRWLGFFGVLMMLGSFALKVGPILGWF